MIRLFANANYDFIKWRRVAFSVTGAIMLIGLIFLMTRGVNYSIEFTGGTLMQVEAHKQVPMSDIRAALDQVGLNGAEIQTFGSDTSFVIRARLAHSAGTTEQTSTEAVVAAIGRALDQSIGVGQYTVGQTAAVGPKVGRELQGKAVMAILLSFVVGAVLTVVGYSLNDTIIIFDRVRENLRKYRRQNLYEILNLSINETLPRSVLTHGTTIATTLSLLVLAGEVIRPFAWVMTFGIFTGTFSSVYIAAPVLLWIEKRWPGQDARGARTFGARAPTGATAPDATRPVPATSSPRAPQPAR